LERRVDQRDPGVVDHDVEAATPLHRALDERPELVQLRHVTDDAERGSVAVHRPDLVDDGGDARLADVGHHDTCPFVGEQVRRGPAHAAGGAGDDRHPARDRSRQSAEPPRLLPGRLVGRRLPGRLVGHRALAVTAHWPGRIW
jgi:hypothetical protein